MGEPDHPPAWSAVVLPDTQVYAARYPELFEAQTRWIAEHAEERRIQFVAHVGDITDDSSPGQWAIAARAIRLLDGRVPYVLAVGNHDSGPGGSGATRDTLLNSCFSVREMAERPSFGGTFEPDKLENSYHVFCTPTGPWLVMALEFGPRLVVLDWAASVIERHPRTPAIIVTHAYLYADGTRYDESAYPAQKWRPGLYGVARLPGGAADGEAMYRRLIGRYDDIRIVVSGHVIDTGVARLTSVRPSGSTVHQMLANYQHRSRGGDRFFRLLEVEAGGKRLHVRTYSPDLNVFKSDDANDFVLEL